MPFDMVLPESELMLGCLHCSKETTVKVILAQGVLPETLGGGVWPASQNSHRIYDQNLQFFLPHLRPDQKFDVPFMTVAPGTVVSYEGLWLMIL